MTDLLIPVGGALILGMLIWGIMQVVSGVSSEKKRLKERLSGDGRIDSADPAHFNVVRKSMELQGFSGVLGKIPGFEGIARKLQQIWPSITLANFVFISLGIGVTVGALVFVLTFAVVMGLGAAAVAMMIPLVILNNKRNKRQSTMMNQLPEALDFLSRILRSGHSLSTGLQMMAQELPNPLASEFRRCYDQHSLGQSFEEALKDTATRVESSDFGFFVTAVLIQRQTGGDLSEVLDNISGMIRGRIRLAGHVKAKTAEGRFTGYILVAFPIIMFIISYALNPAYAGVLLHTSTGLYMLGTAVGLCILGLVAIRKITQIKV